MELIIVIGLFVLIVYLYKRYLKYLRLENTKRASVEHNFKRKIDELNKNITNKNNEIDKIQNEIKKQEELFNQKINQIIIEKNNEINFLKDCIREKDDLFNDLKIRNNDSLVKISSLYSDFLLIQFDISSHYLKTKNHPAKVEAKRIDELKKFSKCYVEQFRQMLYKYEMLLQLFPELSKYTDDFESIKQLEEISSIDILQEDFDRVQFYLSKEEYALLSVDERNQLALDRYIKGQKTKWQIGRDYELFCGITYERDGWDVEYYGMEKKINDMGRDLIAKKNNIHHIIQCKFWAKNKMIHEKHITQLFGTTVEYGMNLSSNTTIKAVFITNIKLSDSARKFADKLGVIVKEDTPLENFPRIKCNVNKDEYGDESLIYHLPFDQQYDRTKINKKGEFYAFNVDEAVKAGFRRANKFFGNN